LIEHSINIERMEEAVTLFGAFDENIRHLEREFNVSIVSRDSELKVSGDGEMVR